MNFLWTFNPLRSSSFHSRNVKSIFFHSQVESWPNKIFTREIIFSQLYSHIRNSWNFKHTEIQGGRKYFTARRISSEVTHGILSARIKIKREIGGVGVRRVHWRWWRWCHEDLHGAYRRPNNSWRKMRARRYQFFDTATQTDASPAQLVFYEISYGQETSNLEDLLLRRYIFRYVSFDLNHRTDISSTYSLANF